MHFPISGTKHLMPYFSPHTVPLHSSQVAAFFTGVLSPQWEQRKKEPFEFEDVVLLLPVAAGGVTMVVLLVVSPFLAASVGVDVTGGACFFSPLLAGVATSGGVCFCSTRTGRSTTILSWLFGFFAATTPCSIPPLPGRRSVDCDGLLMAAFPL